MDAVKSLGPTGVGQGVALPHARLEGQKKCWGPFCASRTNRLISTRLPPAVDIAFALFAPKVLVSQTPQALRAWVSATPCATPLVCAKLRGHPDPATLYADPDEAQGYTAA